jgi:hypothetical protein
LIEAAKHYPPGIDRAPRAPDNETPTASESDDEELDMSN